MAKTAKKAAPTSKAVAKVVEKALAKSNVDVSLLEEQAAGAGVSTDIADNVVPIIKVLQSLSPQVLKQKSEFIKGAEAGMIYPRGERQVFDGEEGIRVVPCYYERVWLEWGPERGDGLKGRHAKGTDDTPRELGAVRKEIEGNERWVLPSGNILQDCRQHVVLVLDKYDEPTPFVLPMTGSNIGVSRQWHPLMNKKKTPSGKKAASYSYVYVLKSTPKSNDKGDWFGMVIEDTGERTRSLQNGDEIFLAANQIFNDFNVGNLVSGVDDAPHAETEEDDSAI